MDDTPFWFGCNEKEKPRDWSAKRASQTSEGPGEVAATLFIDDRYESIVHLAAHSLKLYTETRLTPGTSIRFRIDPSAVKPLRP